MVIRSRTGSWTATHRRLAAWLAATFVALLAVGVGAETPTEYKVKAAFLYNFAKFVEWPPPAASGDEMRLCVVGADPFGAELDELVAGKTVQNKWLRVARLSVSDDIEQCQVAFINAADREDLAYVLRRAHDAHALTVGESHAFIGRGGIISFVMDGNKVRFEINAAAAERAGLRISSQLLKLAARVINEPIAAE
jgi:hypothetical protein